MEQVFDPETGEYISRYEYELKYNPAGKIGASEAIGLTKDVAEIAKMAGSKEAKSAGEDLAKEVATDWSPYAKGAELGSKAISGAIDLKNQQIMSQYLAEVAKYNAEQAKVDRATRVAQGIRV
jgi:hypothetical protein